MCCSIVNCELKIHARETCCHVTPFNDYYEHAIATPDVQRKKKKTSCLCASHEYHVQEFECRDEVLIHRPRLLSNWIYLAIDCALRRGSNDRSKFCNQATMFQCGREREVGPCNAWPPTNSFSTEYSYAGNRCRKKTSEGLSSTEWPCIKQDTSFVT